MSTFYIALNIDPFIEFPLRDIIEYPETTIFLADAKNDIIFFTDDRLLYMQPIKATFNPTV
jgi:hypothetical protein